MKRLLVTVLLALPLLACRNTDIAEANRSAQEFIKNIPNATGVQCADVDTDGDGYVTCTVFRGSGDPLPIQCGSEIHCYNCARGCKYEPYKNIGGGR